LRLTSGGFEQVGNKSSCHPNVRPVNKQKEQIMNLKMKKEQKLEQQRNSDSTVDDLQVSPTCPKPIVGRRTVRLIVNNNLKIKTDGNN
jgi:hypothetical protein